VGDRFVIQWNDVKRWGASCGLAFGPLTFQIVLHHEGTIDLVYANMGSSPAELMSATVGMRGRDSENAVQLAFNQAFVESDLLVRLNRPSSETAACRVWDKPQGVIAPFDNAQVPLRVWNHELFYGVRAWSLAVGYGAGDVPVIVNVIMQPGFGSLDAQLTIRRSGNALVLSWRRFAVPFYCVYSGVQAGLWEFEAAVTDTFYMVPLGADPQRFFQICLCEGPPAAASNGAPGSLHVNRN